MKNLVLFFALIIGAAFASMANELTYSYWDQGDSLTAYGTDKSETYQVGIGIPAADNRLAGKTITQVRVPVKAASSLTLPYCWISTSLELDKGSSGYVFNPALKSGQLTPDDQGFVTWILDEPYLIPDTTVYVGYEIQALQVDDDSSQPILLGSGNVEDDAFWIRATRSFSKFTQYASSQKQVLPITVTLEGDFHPAAIKLEFPANQRLELDANQISVIARNHGTDEVSFFQYNFWDNNNPTYVGRIELDEPLPARYDYAVPLTLTISKREALGNDTVRVRVTYINDASHLNQEGQGYAQAPITVLPFVPTKRPVLEEYTGTWCGNCPRGFVALEKMTEFYPDDFIALAYHDGDPMVMKDGYPNPGIPGFPMSIMDRETLMDPYKGLEGTNFGIEVTWLSYCALDADADIQVQAQWDGDIVRATSTTTWAIEPSSDYSINYVLCANGLTGNGSGWWQCNYYAGQSTSMLYMDEFLNGDSYQQGLTYNHVAVLCSAIDGLGVPGSMDTSALQVNVPWSHTYDFDTTLAVNTADDPIIQDPDQLYVVAMLIDNATGYVLNAAKCACGEKTNSAPSIAADPSSSTDAPIYDLMGRRVENPSSGIYIQNGKKFIIR